MRYETPTKAATAAALLAGEKGTACVLAGGTDLLVRMKAGGLTPDLIVDIKHIDSMRTITSSKGVFRIGGAATGAELGAHTALGRQWPGVVESAKLIGSDQVQGRCTMVGNLCNASPAADTVPALIAADAKVQIVGRSKRRTLAVEKFVTGPGKTALAADEVVEALLLPKRAARSADAYLRFTPRTEMDIAVVSAAVNVTVQRGVVSAARVALGAVAPTAILVRRAARALVGTRLDDGALAALAAACSAVCEPIDDKRGTVEYRTQVAGVLAKRAALLAFERAGGSR